MSFDDPETNADWAAAEGFQYELWTDDSRVLALYYGSVTSPTAGSAGRISVLLDEDGNVLLEYPIVFTGTHPQEVLEDCEALFGP